MKTKIIKNKKLVSKTGFLVSAPKRSILDSNI